ncbi:alpha/beta fold hydrolase [Nocardia iowensis]|uniref:Alpha/beta hydrolase n=1 Tax=Nocardia iowensis TaxID=204891 RepID=A0ABX8RRS5_NOCIO|nr:alpha/beta hydrolase [Nocardia iowensis]QXN91594.1 alpha/beta hydrolase [Nocardia iowensis]
MTDFVTSADGTRIAFDRFGDGAPVVLVSGMFCSRPMTHDLATRLAERFTVINYDRRGRGESGDTAPYAVQREIEDLAALIDELGGKAAVYGHSSGAGLALRAAAAGVPITKLVLHEPPYGDDSDESKRSAGELAEQVTAAVEQNRPAEAVRIFLTAAGAPPEAAQASSQDPGMQAVAPTMPYDLAIMGDSDTGGVIPLDLVRAVDVPVLVLLGDASPEFFRNTATRLTELLPEARLTVLEGQDHGAPAEFVAPPVASFLA